jgi:hypothetical protein
MMRYIQVRYYNPNYYNQIVQYLKHNNHFNCIGHSRVFIIEALLKETKLPVIYLDNDTGFTTGSKDIILDMIYIDKPIGYAKENFCTFRSNMDNVENIKITDNNLITKFNLNSRPINNGAIIYPYNDVTLEFVKENIKIYNDAITKMSSMFLDMLSFTLTYNKFQCDKVILENIPENYFSIPVYQNKFSDSIIHYCYKKLDEYNEIEPYIEEIMSNASNDIFTLNDNTYTQISQLKFPIKYLFVTPDHRK